jgi:hypothetical protein
MMLTDLDGGDTYPLADPTLYDLEHGQLYRFAEWRTNREGVPRVAAGVYTIWDGDRLIYAGMAGARLTAEHIARQKTDEDIRREEKGQNPSRKFCGVGDRLGAHAGGRRSGDQFCVYVGDRFVIPTLTPAQQAAIGDGTLSLDRLIREHVHGTLTYRYTLMETGPDAVALERRVLRGALSAGLPFLNPVSASRSQGPQRSTPNAVR